MSRAIGGTRMETRSSLPVETSVSTLTSNSRYNDISK